RLEALAGVAARNAVDLAGRSRPDLLQNAAVDLAGGHREPDLAEARIGIEAERLPLLADAVGDLADAIIESRQRDAAVLVTQPVEDRDEDMDRILRGAAIHARMQVARGGGDGDLLADQAAQHGRHRRRFAIP